MKPKGYILYKGRYFPADPDGYEEHTCGTCDMWQAPQDEPEHCSRYPYSDDLDADAVACPNWAWGKWRE